MKTFTIIFKAVTLLTLAIISLMFIFGEPDENSANWYSVFFITKAIGFASLRVICKLYGLWEIGTLVKNMD